MSDQQHQIIYALVADIGDEEAVRFYVGRHAAGSSRTQDHFRNAFNSNSNEYETNKYRFMRELRGAGIEARVEILCEMAQASDDDEYSWVLRIADENRNRGLEFYGNPLTNMKAGDFLSEMLADRSVRTAQEVRAWRQRREEQEHQARYDRILDRFGDQSQAGFRRLFTPERLEEFRQPPRQIRAKKTTDFDPIARREWLEAETRRLIERDRSEGRTLPGGISDE